MKKLLLIIFLQISLTACSQKNETQNIKSNKHIEYDKEGNISVEGYLKDQKKYGVWKFYNNKKLVDVKKFNEDTLQYVLDVNDYNYKGVIIKKINSIIPLPENWETNLNFENPNTLLTSVKDCKNESYCPNIIVTSEEQTSSSFEKHVNDFKNQIINNYKDVKILELKKNPLTKEESFQMKYSYTHNNIELIYIIFWMKDNKNITTFCGSCEKVDYIKYSYLFYEIGNSIKKIKNN